MDAQESARLRSTFRGLAAALVFAPLALGCTFTPLFFEEFGNEVPPQTVLFEPKDASGNHLLLQVRLSYHAFRSRRQELEISVRGITCSSPSWYVADRGAYVQPLTAPVKTRAAPFEWQPADLKDSFPPDSQSPCSVLLVPIDMSADDRQPKLVAFSRALEEVGDFELLRDRPYGDPMKWVGTFFIGPIADLVSIPFVIVIGLWTFGSR